MRGAKPSGATWEYNPVDVRPDLQHRNPAPKLSGIWKKSPTPKGVPVDVRPDTFKPMPKAKLRADTGSSPSKAGWKGSRVESFDAASNLCEDIDDVSHNIFG